MRCLADGCALSRLVHDRVLPYCSLTSIQKLNTTVLAALTIHKSSNISRFTHLLQQFCQILAGGQIGGHSYFGLDFFNSKTSVLRPRSHAVAKAVAPRDA
jgi:hypothetical protein